MDKIQDPAKLEAFRKKVQTYHKVKRREECEETLFEFLRDSWMYVDSGEFSSCWAIEAMCDHLEAVTLGHIPRLLINIPPRCTKTTLCSIVFPAWTWARSKIAYWSGPQVRFLCASYGHTLSLDSSNKSRRLLNSQWYQDNWGYRFNLRDDQNMKWNYANSEGGERLATSVGGTLIGLGGDILIADDLNNTEEVESEAERANVATFWNEFHSTRLNNPQKSAIIVIQQRLSEGDVSGLILDSDEDWIHLCIPMRYEEGRTYTTVVLPQYDDPDPWDDPRAEEGELMWPERFDEPAVIRLERALGPYMASGRLQQSPAPKGGGILKREWWQTWDMDEARRYGLEWSGARKEFPHCDLVIASLDTSFGEKEENDFNSLTIWGLWVDRNKNRRAMLMYGWAKRLPLHGVEIEAKPGEDGVVFRERQKAHWGLIEWVADSCKRYKVRRLLIENKARGYDVGSEINRLYARENWGVELINPVKDKVARAHSVVPLFTDNIVWAPDTRWADAVISQCAVFPKGEHDDHVDSCTQFLNWARTNQLLVRADEASAALVEESTHRHPSNRDIARAYGV